MFAVKGLPRSPHQLGIDIRSPPAIELLNLMIPRSRYLHGSLAGLEAVRRRDPKLQPGFKDRDQQPVGIDLLPAKHGIAMQGPIVSRTPAEKRHSPRGAPPEFLDNFIATGCGYAGISGRKNDGKRGIAPGGHLIPNRIVPGIEERPDGRGTERLFDSLSPAG